MTPGGAQGSEAQVPVELVDAEGATFPSKKALRRGGLHLGAVHGSQRPSHGRGAAPCAAPRGRLHFVEHVHPRRSGARSSASRIRCAPSRVAATHRDTLHSLRNAGFSSVTIEPSPTAGRTLPIYRGVAVR